MDWEAELRGVLDEQLLPLAHRLAAPAGNGVLVDRLAFVGDHQVLVDADDLAVPFAAGAGPERVVEAEEVLGGVFELDAVGLEARRELLLGVVRQDGADPVPVGKGAGHRVPHTGLRVVVLCHAEPVHDYADPVGGRFGAHRGDEILDELHPAAGMDAHQAVREQQRELLDESLPGAAGPRSLPARRRGRGSGPRRHRRRSSAPPVPIRGSRCGRCGRRAASGSRRSRWSCRPSSGDCAY